MTGKSSSGTESATQRHTAAWITAIGIAVLAVATALAWSWRSQLPDPVASHWGPGGAADRFSSLESVLAVMDGIGLAMVLGFGAVIGLLGQSVMTRRIAAGAAIWSAVFLSMLTLGTLQAQRGLAEAHDVGGIDAVLAVAFAGSLLAAIAAGAFVPRDPRLPTSEPIPADAPRARLSAGERTTWTAHADSGPAIALGVVAVAVLLALTVVTQIWALLIVIGVLAVVIVSMCRWAVRIDREGLTIRSALGWPRIHVPLDEVVRAEVVQVRALREFGGWGLRVGRHGRVGVILRSGQALLVRRTGERSVAVTVDGATGAAGLLNALAERTRHG